MQDRRIPQRVEVDRETLRRILALPLDQELEAELDAVEEPLGNPWQAS